MPAEQITAAQTVALYVVTDGRRIFKTTTSPGDAEGYCAARNSLPSGRAGVCRVVECPATFSLPPFAQQPLRFG